MRTILLAALAFTALGSQAAYRCVDEKGVTHVGDQPPAACAKVPVLEVSRSGALIRRIEPSLTPEEATAKADATAKHQEQAKIAAELKRKDLALISTYGTEKDFDIARDRNVEPIKARIKLTQERITAVDKRIKEFDDEMEFYKAGKSGKAKGKTREAPQQLVSDLDRAKAERIQLVKSVADSEREMVGIRAKFETDKARWLVLKNNPAERGAAQAAEAKSAKK